MYRDMLAWRDDAQVEAIYDGEKETPCREITLRLVSNAHHRCDRYGRPLYMEKTGRIHIEAFRALMSDGNVVATHIWCQEHLMARMRESSRRLGRPVNQCIFVMDMAGLSLRFRKSVHLFKLVSQIDLDYYPEMLGAMYFVNCPWLFPILWGLVRPLLDRKTKSKIHILGSDLTPMVNDLGPECLPVEYGGTCECPDGCMNPVLTPEELQAYLDENNISLDVPWGEEVVPEPELTERHLSARETFDVLLESDHEHVNFGWYFRTVKRDISYAVDFFPGATRVDDLDKFERVEVRPAERVEAHKEPVHGTFAAQEQGVCRITFSNAFSRWNGKTVRYHVSTSNIDDVDNHELSMLEGGDDEDEE